MGQCPIMVATMYAIMYANLNVFFVDTGGKEIPAKFVGAQLMDHWIFNFLVQAIWPLQIQGMYSFHNYLYFKLHF